MFPKVTRSLLASLVVATPFSAIAFGDDEATSDDGEMGRVPSTSARLQLSDAEIESTRDSDVVPSSFKFQEPAAPVAPLPTEPQSFLPSATTQFSNNIFSSDGIERSQLSTYRRNMVFGPATDLVFGSEGKFRVSTDGANLLGKSLAAPGVRTQQRSPISNDPRIRGSQTGRTLASGSYWAPARQDLDTILNKIDSRLIANILVVKGPYSSLFGPGYDFVDYQMAGTPRYDSPFEIHGSTSIEYNTNGQQIYGRQSLWGGGEDYGFRASYGHRTANNYTTGDGWELPSSYNSRDASFAYGYDFSPDSHLEFTYIRLDQTGVEFPGLVFDINYLVTDGFDLKYSLENQPEFDLWTIDGWYNRTRFEGDTSRPGKNAQIPGLRVNHVLGPDQFLRTDVDGMSAGYRTSVSWGVDEEPTLTVGTDLIRVGQQLNDYSPATIDPFLGPIPETNAPIPRSNSIDLGLFVEQTTPVDEIAKVRVGGRVDLVTTNARNNVPETGVLAGFPPTLTVTPIDQLLQSELEQHFTPWNLFVTGELQLTPVHVLTGGVGHGRRPPTLTELYAVGSYIGSLQPGLSYVYGDPTLQMEKNTQFDLGIKADYETIRFGLQGFHSIIRDYITYDYLLPYPNTVGLPFVPGDTLQGLGFTNTDLATLTGFEFSGQADITDQLLGFVVMDYVQGTDHSRNTPSRLATFMRPNGGLPVGNRSLVNRETEPLPGISPLQARAGARLHEASERPDWMVELEVRMVAEQNRVAASLYEQPTAGFAVWNLRGFYRPAERVTMFGGVENFTDRMYREHLDFRSGRGVYRPGVNFYASMEVTY